MKALLLFAFLGSQLFTIAQVNATYWGIADTNLTLSKTTDFGTVHDYLELYNYSGQDLQMRWVASFQPNWPSLWNASFADPSNWYSSVVENDSGDFTMPDPIGFQNKLIIGVAHYSQAGQGTIDFKVFPVDHPEDFLILHYSTIIAQGNAYASVDSENDISVRIFTVAQKVLKLVNVTHKSEITVYDIAGKQVFSQTAQDTHFSADLSHLQSGMYIVNCSNMAGDKVVKKIII